MSLLLTMRVRSNGEMAGFQPADAGSTPATRTEEMMDRERTYDEGFTGCRSDHAPVAQVVERLPEEQGVVGSTPTRSTFEKSAEELRVYEMSDYQKRKQQAMEGVWEMERRAQAELFESITGPVETGDPGDGRAA